MEYIHKTISLEKHKARIPINIPPCDTSLLCLYRDSMDGAWGMLPQTIVIPENIARYISAQCDVDVNIPLKAESNEYYPCFVYSDELYGYYENKHIEYPTNEKYNKVYYVLNGTLFEHTFGTNEEKQIKCLTYNTLHKWFKFFCFYADTFMGGFGMMEFKSATDRYLYEQRLQERHLFNFTQEECERYDSLFESRGGEKMLNWLLNDIVGWRRVSLEDWKDYYDLVPHYMYYGQIRQWLVWFEDKVSLYGNLTWQQCKDTDSCCECKDWFRKGGMQMYEWLKKQTEPNDISENCIDGRLSIKVMLTNKVDDFGIYAPLIADFSVNGRYSEGDDVLYDNHIYQLQKDEVNKQKGIAYSNEYKEKIFGNLNAEKYIEQEFRYEELEDDKKVWKLVDGALQKLNYGQLISGSTTSKLNTLIDLVRSTDDMGNELNGILYNYADDAQYDSDSTTYFIQPKEGTIMDLCYHKGNVYELEREFSLLKDTEQEGVYHDLYWGDIIEEMRFFIKDGEGHEIPIQQGKEDLFYGTNDTNLNALERCDKEIRYWQGEQIEGFETALVYDGEKGVDSTIYLDIKYTIGGIVDRTYCELPNDTFSYYTLYKPTNKYINEINQEVTPYKYDVGVHYTEHAHLEKNQEYYYTNDGTSILLNFYELKFPIGYAFNDKHDPFDFTERVADFVTISYCIKENDYNGVVSLQMVHRETDLQLKQKYRETADIYVDRGIRKCVEKQLKLQEIRSMEALEQYGNGTFIVTE